MGKNKNKKKRQNKQDGGGDKKRVRKTFEEYKAFLIEKRNEKFETYYKDQKIVPPEEWEEFMATLRIDLPIAFRLSQINGFESELLGRLNSDEFGKEGQRFVMDITGINQNSSASAGRNDGEEQTVGRPTCLKWHPGGLGWMVDVSKKNLKRVKEMEPFRQFLMSETTAGNVSRQEAVSMIPTLCLDMQPHHKILDMCAAPGSKTAQILDVLHSEVGVGERPTGFVIANDADNKRAYMLVHQLKRFASPSFLVTTHEAQHFPTLFKADYVAPEKSTTTATANTTSDASTESKSEEKESDADLDPRHVIKFDRILCDVPCSGDGTMRKSAMLWKQWDVSGGISLHVLQTQIAVRGIQMLQTGGLMCYSTCSFNPIENEAVVAALLRRGKGAIELVDIREKLPGLITSKGLETWRVHDSNHVYDSFSDVAQRRWKKIKQSMFPPTKEEAKEFNLHYCLRLLPHKQNTGGFFVALLRKTRRPDRSFGRGPAEPTSDWQNKEEESASTTTTTTTTTTTIATPAPKAEADVEKQATAQSATGTKEKIAQPALPAKTKQKKGGFKEDPFLPLDKEVFNELKKHYEITDDLKLNYLFSRHEKGRKVYMLSKDLSEIVTNPNNRKLKVVHTGVRVFESRLDKNERAHRVTQEGVYYVAKDLKKQVVQASVEDMCALLKRGNLKFSDLDQESDFTKQLIGCGQGSGLVILPPNHKVDRQLCCCVWMTEISATLMVPMEERKQYARYLGIKIDPPKKKETEDPKEQDKDTKEQDKDTNEQEESKTA